MLVVFPKISKFTWVCHLDWPSCIFWTVFTEFLIIAFRQNRSLQDIIGKKTIVNNRKQICQNINQNVYLKSCNSKLNNLCCMQVLSISTFSSTVTPKTFKIYHKLNCKSKSLMYLMKCVLCNNQCTGKFETTFEVTLSPSKNNFFYLLQW